MIKPPIPWALGVCAIPMSTVAVPVVIDDYNAATLENGGSAVFETGGDAVAQIDDSANIAANLVGDGGSDRLLSIEDVDGVGTTLLFDVAANGDITLQPVNATTNLDIDFFYDNFLSGNLLDVSNTGLEVVFDSEAGLQLTVFRITVDDGVNLNSSPNRAAQFNSQTTNSAVDDRFVRFPFVSDFPDIDFTNVVSILVELDSVDNDSDFNFEFLSAIEIIDDVFADGFESP